MSHLVSQAHVDDETDDVVLAFSLNAAAMLVRNGAAAVNVTRTLLALARTAELSNVTASVEVSKVSLSYTDPETGFPVTRMHEVDGSGLNVTGLALVESTVERVVTRTISFKEGLDELALTERQERRRDYVSIFIGWFFLGAGFAWMMGGTGMAALVSGALIAIVEAVGGRLARLKLPGFYTHVASAFLAVILTAGAASVLDIPRPALMIVAALVVRLAGVTSLGAAHDLLTGWYLTATARLMSAVMDTLGLVSGVMLGLTALQTAHVPFAFESDLAQSSALWQAAVAAGFVAGGFALASRGRFSHVPVIAVLGSLAALTSGALEAVGIGKTPAVALAAFLLGILCTVVARPLSLPSLAALTTALVPLLPGMAIYSGFIAFALHQSNGPSEFLNAGATALAIGAGAVLGQFVLWRMLWRAKRAQYRYHKKHIELRDLDDRQFDAQSLVTPDFRRPFVQD